MSDILHKILVVDDEPGALDMIKEFFSARDYEVLTALDGEEALDIYDSAKPEVIISDIRMPKKDGFEFLKELRSKRDWVPVIMLSAHSEPSTVLQGYKLEADYYIAKPVNLPDLERAVKLMLSLIPIRKK